MTLLDWSADYTDPIDFQNDVLRWLERHGVKRPAEAMIEGVRIERAGEGAIIAICRYVRPATAANFHDRIIDRIPMCTTPPKRPW